MAEPSGALQGGYTKHFPCTGEELMSALTSCMAPASEQSSAAQPAAERPHYASPSTLKSSSTLRSTSDTAGALPGPARLMRCSPIQSQGKYFLP